MSGNALSQKISEKAIKIHSISILAVCIVFGIVNLIGGTILTGVLTAAMGVILPLFALVILKKADRMVRGIFLTQGTTVVILVLSATKGELHSMYPLLIASIAIGSIYYNLRNIEVSWALIDVVAIAAVFFKNIFYIGAESNVILNGIIGINVAAFMIRLLVKNIIANVNDVVKASDETNELLGKVQDQMEETKVLSDRQTDIMHRVSGISEGLEASSASMLEISSKISAASEEQASAVSEVYKSVDEFTEKSKESIEQAEAAVKAAQKSVDMLNSNNEDMHKMVAAMEKINESSQKISSIINTIEDISFQTNILALNAAVEAARAGESGKGFAVVADEVRNLANRSAEAVKNTSALINDSLAAVESGTVYAKNAAESMNSVIEISVDSENHAKRIAEVTGNQQAAVEELKDRMEYISSIISENANTAEESAQIAQSVSDEINALNEIVSGK